MKNLKIWRVKQFPLSWKYTEYWESGTFTKRRLPWTVGIYFDISWNTPLRGIRFRVPGAFHHARWMSKVIYILKIFLFQTQFKLTKRESAGCLEFGSFVSLIYVKAWITCSYSCDAPFNDFHLIKVLTKYSSTSKVISATALKAIVAIYCILENN